MNINIELMSINHYDEIYNLWINTNGMGLNNVDDSYDGIKKFIDRNPDTNFIAKVDGRIVGTIMCGHDGRRGHIYHTSVDINYRNNGIGKLLVDNAVNGLANQGITKVSLVVFKHNESGNIFWEKSGFTERPDLIFRNKIIKEL